MELPPKIDRQVYVKALMGEVPGEIRVLVDRINDDYEYWDKVKHKPLPEGCTSQMLWTYVKASRLRGMMKAWDKYGIKLCVTSQMQRLCHEFDMLFGSF